MSRIVTVDIPVCIQISGGAVDLIATVRASYTPPERNTYSPIALSPPDPEAIEDAEVLSLVTDDRDQAQTRDCPQWLADAIIAQADGDIREAANDEDDR